MYDVEFYKDGNENEPIAEFVNELRQKEIYRITLKGMNYNGYKLERIPGNTKYNT